MPGTRKKSVKVRDYILDRIASGSDKIPQRVSQKFGISPQAANKHLSHLTKLNLIEATGRTRNRKYELKPLYEEKFNFDINPELKEDVIWRETIKPIIARLLEQGNMTKNTYDICHYGFTEMFNNVIDHSKGSDVWIKVSVNARKIKLFVVDNGIGVFENLQKHFGLEDARHAILELIKGKVTSDPERHTGEGIFFTSRMFDCYKLISDKLAYIRIGESDWLIKDRNDSVDGTTVAMEISNKCKRSMQEVFRKYEDEDYDFTKTMVPVELAIYEGETLVSRSQAKRLLAGLEKFSIAMLDFKGVKSIGRAFADEVFRVFSKEHPGIKLVPVNMNPEIEKIVSNIVKKQYS